MIGFIIATFAYVFPAYVANASPAFLAGVAKRRFHPVDCGKKLRGKRIFGDGKTIEGTAFGLLCGTLMAVLIGIVASGTSYALGVDYLMLGLLMSVGTLLGDMLGSFIKRRIGIKRGGKAPLMDQLGFVVVAMLFGAIIYVPSLLAVVFLLIVTPAIHLFLNYAAYKLGMKDVPW